MSIFIVCIGRGNLVQCQSVRVSRFRPYTMMLRSNLVLYLVQESGFARHGYLLECLNWVFKLNIVQGLNHGTQYNIARSDELAC